MGIGDRFKRMVDYTARESHPDGLAELIVGDAAYDDWEVVQDFGELETARAFRQSLAEHGYEAVITADWPVDEQGRGDIALRVRPGKGLEAEELLESP